MYLIIHLSLRFFSFISTLPAVRPSSEGKLLFTETFIALNVGQQINLGAQCIRDDVYFSLDATPDPSIIKVT